MLIAASVLLPILLTIAIGVALDRFRSLDTRTLSSVSIYVLTPALVFYSLYTTKLSGADIAKIALFLPLLTAGLWLLTRTVLWARRDKPSDEGPSMLGALFMNAGNYGIPMCRSAFGSAGVEQGVVWVIVQNSLLFPLATYYAARDMHGGWDAVKAVFRLPAVYVVFLAGMFRWAGIVIPGAILDMVQGIGYAMIPMAQLLLGAQLSKTAKEAKFADYDRIVWVSVIRLIASPMIAIPICSLLGVSGVTRSALILLSGTPTAVNITILALEFNARPHFIAAMVFFSTLASFLTLSAILMLL